MQGPGEQPGARHRRTPSVSVNLRDVGAGAGAKANLKEGAMFRASQILRRATLRDQKILRQEVGRPAARFRWLWHSA